MRLLPALLCLLPWLPATAQLGRYSLDITPSRTDFADTIAISHDHGQVLLPVAVAGVEHRFLLDTGSGQAVVYDDVRLPGTMPIGQMAAHDAMGRRDTVPLVRLPEVTIGATTYSGLQATVQRRPSSAKGYDGVVGFDLVCRGLLMKIDVPHGRLIVTDRPHHFDGEQGVSLRYRLNYHVPYLTVFPFARHSETVLFDTGSRQLFAMNKASFDAAEQRLGQAVSQQTEGRCEGRHAIGFYGSEATGEVVFLALDSLMLGTLPLRDVHALTTQGGSHLGAPLLEHGAVVFLPRKKRMVFIPTDGERDVTVGNAQTELSFVIEQGQTVVGLVWPLGEAYKAGFRVGDVVRKYYADEGLYLLRDTRGFDKQVVWK